MYVCLKGDFCPYPPWIGHDGELGLTNHVNSGRLTDFINRWEGGTRNPMQGNRALRKNFLKGGEALKEVKIRN